jgi:hypothetical protein
MTPPPAAVSSLFRRRRWLRRLLFALLLAGAVYLARAPLLRGTASLLIVEDPVREVDALVLLNGDRLWERAAALYHAGAAKRLMLFHDAPGRLERLGVLPDPDEEIRREREKYTIPETAVEVLKIEKHGDWNRARRLRDWLNEHSEAQVFILCDRFSSRRAHCLYTRELGGLSERVHWQALPDRRYDETSWQRNKVGVLQLFDSYLSWGHVWLYGDALGDQQEWDPDAYQNKLR